MAPRKYIRVETPVTTDGMNLDYGDNNQVRYKTTILPSTARQELERNASKLPKHLQPKITDVTATAAAKDAGPTTAEKDAKK